MEFLVAAMSPEDWPVVRRIYEEGIATGNATFETAVPGWERWHANHRPRPRLVARSGGIVVGWAALSPISARPAYSGVGEVSVYVASEAGGAGIGRGLLERLIAESEQDGVWTLQAGIFPENEASLALHVRCGFRLVGRRERVGCLQGRWRDVLVLERRSQVVGATEPCAPPG
jgi:L-amino acid N-acyltransferase YncA